MEPRLKERTCTSLWCHFTRTVQMHSSASSSKPIQFFFRKWTTDLVFQSCLL